MVPQLQTFVCATPYDVNQYCNTIRQHAQSYPVLGLDAEWNTYNTRNKIALVQLCTDKGYCVLFRLSAIGMPQALKQILEDRDILKVGVGSTIDAKHLTTDYGIHPKGVVDIRYLCSQLTGSRNGGLDDFAREFLGIHYNTNQGRSDWERPQLNDSQIEYAAKVRTRIL